MPKSTSEPVFFECGHCHTKVQGEDHGRANFYVELMNMPEEWILATCSNCEMPNVIGRKLYGLDGQKEVWGDDWRVYPPRARTFGPEVPNAIRKTYDEAQANLRSGSFLSTALMCRRTVELLAKDLGVKGRDLATKLRNLHTDETIDSRLYEWAEALRFAGNDAAHEDDPAADISKEDANDLAIFTEAIIDFVYIYRARFDEFQARRPSRKKPTITTSKKKPSGA